MEDSRPVAGDPSAGEEQRGARILAATDQMR
jgi:hypothetical protein